MTIDSFQQEDQTGAPPPIDQAVIDEARNMGWVDKTEWRGNPDHWRDANEYVRRGQEVLPIVRAQLERERAERQKREEEITRQNREFEDRVRRQEDAARALQERLEAQEREFQDRTERNDRMARIALERQRQTFLEQIDAAKMQAVTEGDSQKYAAYVERERQFYRDIQKEDEQYAAKSERAQTPPPQRQQQTQQQSSGLTARDQRVRDEWIENNPWFLRSPELNTEAQRIHMELWEKAPGLDLAQNLERVTSELKKKYPEKFGISQESTGQNALSGGAQERTSQSTQSNHSFVEGGNSGPASSSTSSGYRRKGWSDIHPDDRAIAEKSYINAGFYGSDPQKAREEYAKDYWEINGE